MSGIERYIRNWFKKRPQPTPVPEPPIPVPDPSHPGRLTVIPGPFAPRLYSYWSNSWVRSDGATFVFAGHLDHGPLMYMIRNGNAEIVNWTPPIPGSETEGWYWDRQGMLYFPRGNELLQIPPFLGGGRVAFSVGNAGTIKQCHSSDDGEVHSATLNDVSTIVSFYGSLMEFYSTRKLDESQITTNGRYLIIKETDHEEKLWNRVISLPDKTEYELPPGESIGHSDVGNNFIIGADAWSGHAVRLDLAFRMRTQIFSTWNMGHVSVRDSKTLWSRHEHGVLALGTIHDNNQTPEVIFEHGIRSDEYDQQVRANLSPCGTRATFLHEGNLCVLEL